ncbi:MAG: transposase [Eubacteriales bacterium]|nr:transposase [Eubacteriales bacterium]
MAAFLYSGKGKRWKYWKKKIFWSDGYFACSIGKVSPATIQIYIESQR